MFMLKYLEKILKILCLAQIFGENSQKYMFSSSNLENSPKLIMFSSSI